MTSKTAGSLALSMALVTCASPRPPAAAQRPQSLENESSPSFGESAPEDQGVDANTLTDLTNWVIASESPIFSILISRNGKLVYELYTSELGRDEAHYVMSVTKSFTSALVGIAIKEKALPSADASVADLLPASLFASEAERARFARVTLKDVLAMSALDAQVPPHLVNAETVVRARAFREAANRAQFAVSQTLLPEPGSSFQYTDVTPLLATGALEYATKERAFDFAVKHLFEPLGFRNEEWMHEDGAGIDNGAYGLRVRPIDMQKFGVLYLNDGVWNGAQLLPASWVEASFTPWIRSKPSLREPNYGWYWWQFHFGPWVAHVADGWKGQRIAVVREERLVVTMTADIEQGEDAVFGRVMSFVRDAVRPGPMPASPEAYGLLRVRLNEARASRRITKEMEPRMVPQIEPKERHHPFGG